MRYRLAPKVTLVEREGASYLKAEAPLTLIKLNRPLVELVLGMQVAPVAPATPAEAEVLEILAVRGLLLRLSEETEAAELPTVSVVIPVLDRADELKRCLDSLAGLDYPKDKLQVIVVDDGSRDSSPVVAREFGAEVISSGGVRRGPAAARNAGAARATGAILAFIDSDCTASAGWLADLMPLFADRATAAVGGLVEGMCDASRVDRYEAVMSSLSLGGRERFGSAGDDTFYLPSCNLLVRRAAFTSVNGFHDSMHVGEDVDLTWRLRDAGWTIAYLPSGRVFHEHRSSLRSFMSRRFDYGTSEGMLQKLHPNRRKKFLLPPALGAVLALLLAAPFSTLWLAPLALGLLLADAGVYRLRLARRSVPIGFGAVLGGRLRALAGLGYYLSYHLIRYYLVALAALSLLYPPLALFTLAAFLTCAGVDFALKKARLSFVSFGAVYLLEQISYGLGVFWGCLKGGEFASYRVELMKKMELSA